MRVNLTAIFIVVVSFLLSPYLVFAQSLTYTYSPLGNITSKTGQGDYYYQGDQGESYANPHAVTQVGQNSLTYDNNGNLVSFGSLTNEWDYNNQLVATQAGATTTVYAYDPNGERVQTTVNGTPTTDPTKYYSLTGLTPTKQVFVPSTISGPGNDELLATIKGGGANAVIHYVHTDHLSGSNVVSKANGLLEETLDYYPYGESRLDETVGAFEESKKFTGHRYDVDTGLNYMEARYQDGEMGRFVSQDPAFVVVGNSKRLYEKIKGKKPTGKQDPMSEEEYQFVLQDYLSKPQGLNSYSYVVNNPLKYKDPTGENPLVPMAGGALIGGLGGLAGQYYGDVIQNISTGQQGVNVLMPSSSWGEYGMSMISGSLAGGISALGPAGAIVGGSIGIGGSMLKDQVFEGRIDYTAAGVQGVIGLALPLGVNKVFGKVVGRQVSTFSRSFLTGTHTQRQATVAGLNIALNNLANTLRQIAVAIAELKKLKTP